MSKLVLLILEKADPERDAATDITYIPMKAGFVYLVAIMDWYSSRFDVLRRWHCCKRWSETLSLSITTRAAF